MEKTTDKIFTYYYGPNDEVVMNAENPNETSLFAGGIITKANKTELTEENFFSDPVINANDIKWDAEVYGKNIKNTGDLLLNLGVGNRTEDGGEVFNTSTVAGKDAHAEGGAFNEIIKEQVTYDTYIINTDDNKLILEREETFPVNYELFNVIDINITEFSSKINHIDYAIKPSMGGKMKYILIISVEQKLPDLLEIFSVQLKQVKSLSPSAASGRYSHAEGASTTASGEASHAEGAKTIAAGNYSHVGGNKSKANGINSFVHGLYCEANGDNSIAMGSTCTAENLNSISMGGTCKSTGKYSFSKGYQTNANGIFSSSEGYRTTANGRASHAEGGVIGEENISKTIIKDNINCYDIQIINEYKFSITVKMGYDDLLQFNGGIFVLQSSIDSDGNIINITSSSMSGETNYIFTSDKQISKSGELTVVELSRTIVNPHISNIAAGDYSHVEGYSTIANNKYEHAQGKFNISNNINTYHTLHSVGFGINDFRKNAIELLDNGKLYINGVGKYDGVLLNKFNIKEGVQSVQEYIESLETTIADLTSRIEALEGVKAVKEDQISDETSKANIVK